MSLAIKQNAIQDPFFFHREYSNDIKKEDHPRTWVDQTKRIALVALPFFSLCKPLSFPLALAMGGIRTWTSTSQLIASIQKGNTQEIPYQLLQVTLAVASVAATIFAHPMGMLLTTGHDLVIGLMQLAQHLHAGNHRQALETSVKILSNALYLALFFHSGLPLAIGALSLQILVGLGDSASEFQKGNYLEGTGHLLLSMLRVPQVARGVQTLHKIRQIENAKRHAVITHKETPRPLLSRTKIIEKTSNCDKETWEKVLEYAQKNLSQEGVLDVKPDGFTYIKVDDDYIHTLFPMLELSQEGYKKPPYFRRPDAAGAHISVFYENENIKAAEIGQSFHFDLKKVTLVHPTKDISYAVIQVESPELEALRQKYGLSPKLHGHEFHISIAKKNWAKS